MSNFKLITLVSIIFIYSCSAEFINHECGFAFIFLRKPLSYYRTKYGDHAWGLKKVCLLLEKQRHRGQDGAGIALVKLDMPPGEKYFPRIRSAKENALDSIINIVFRDINATRIDDLELLTDLELKQKYEFIGEIYLGHIRYGTFSKNGKSFCQPFLCKNNLVSKSFALAGNFNMTNAQDILKQLTHLNIHPTSSSDTELILQQISYFLDQEHEHVTAMLKTKNLTQDQEYTRLISQNLNLINVLEAAAKNWDGGYVFASILGNGDAFICRDPAGIRPGFFYCDEEVIAAASERAALASVFNVEPHTIPAIKPGHAIIIKHEGTIEEKQFAAPLPVKECSFERIYFSRGTDPAIYQERKALGASLAKRVLAALDYNLENVIFTCIPNTSEAAFRGLIEEIQRTTLSQRIQQLLDKVSSGYTPNKRDIELLALHLIQAEQLVYKNQRLRTFIANDQSRSNLVASLYDVTKGIVKPTDTLVAIDDSIVRGTTLRESVIKKLIELNPKRIIIVSSAPPIMYPDCYGIDMSELEKFIAFNAAISLLKEQDKGYIIKDVQAHCTAQENASSMTNYVQRIYQHISLEQLEKKIAHLVRPKDSVWTGELTIIYQTLEGLHQALPHHTGDWYFTGDYPTQGGYKVLNRSFLNWCQGIKTRAY